MSSTSVIMKNRLRRFLRQRLKTLLVLGFSLFWLLIGEYGVFEVYSWRWYWSTADSVLSTNASCLNTNEGPPYCYSALQDAFFFPVSASKDSSTVLGSPKAELKMLILSDLHIMCTYNDEWWFARWDADRYLRQSISYVMSTLSSPPDVVVLLGDVFSNGYRASHQQWQDYLNCFRKIVSLPPDIQLIVILGDNDIGGEGQDLMTDIVMRRYQEKFGSFNQIISYKEYQFVKLTTVCYINSHLQTTSEKKCRHDLDHFLTHETTSAHHPYDIIFSHVPLNYLSPATYTNGLSTVNIKTKILSSLNGTRFIFSGHIHHTMFSTHSRSGPSVSTGRVWSHRLARDSIVHEITVPTCSYRMGERYMGVGAAILNQGGGLVYKVLWLPPRYPVLISYLLLLVILATLLVCYMLPCKCFLPLCGRLL